MIKKGYLHLLDCKEIAVISSSPAPKIYPMPPNWLSRRPTLHLEKRPVSMFSRPQAIAVTLILVFGLIGLDCPQILAKTTPKAHHPGINNFFQVAPTIYRGATPANEEAIRELSQMGIKSIINLRYSYFSVKRERSIAKRYGIKFFHVPLGYFKPSNEKTSQILKLMTNPENQPVFVHCRYGSDRTGMVIGLYRTIFQDWSFKRTYKEMRTYHFKPWFSGLRAIVKRGKTNPTLLSIKDEVQFHPQKISIADATSKNRPTSM